MTVTRKDAAANRRHIVEVARTAFAADGLDLPMREIARRSGLGVATVYRHFPARPELIGAVLTERVAACEAEVRDALAEPDAGRALRVIIERFAERQIHDRGLNEALLGSHAAGRSFTAQRQAHAQTLKDLVARARAAGAIRSDLTVNDVRVALRAIASLRTLPAEQATDAIRRLTALLLAGMAGPSSGQGMKVPSDATAR